MRSYLINAALILTAALLATSWLHHKNTTPSSNAQPAAQAYYPKSSNSSLNQASSSGGIFRIKSDSNGHFYVQGKLSGRSVDFMVDTGATVIALRESDARNVGYNPKSGDYNHPVATANGTVKAAPIILQDIQIGSIIVDDVPALILPDEALGMNLLGMSFLSRLDRFTVESNELLLED